MNTIDDSAGRAGSNSLRSTLTTTIAARARGRAGRALAASVLAVGFIAGIGATPASADWGYRTGTVTCVTNRGWIQPSVMVQAKDNYYSGGEYIRVEFAFQQKQTKRWIFSYDPTYLVKWVPYGWSHNFTETYVVPWSYSPHPYRATHVWGQVSRLGRDGYWHPEGWSRLDGGGCLERYT